MTDSRLRELERRFIETGSVEDEAAWLRERVRVGEWTRERLQFVAYLGHEAAEVAEKHYAEPRDSADMLLGLGVWGMTALVRAALALVWKDLAEWAPEYRESEAWRAFELVESEFVAKGKTQLPLKLVEAEVESYVVTGDFEGAARVSRVRSLLQLLVTKPEPKEVALLLAMSFGTEVPSGGRPAVEGEGEWERRVRQAHSLSDRDQEAVRSELLPWALGTGDPVRDRVEARQREAACE